MTVERQNYELHILKYAVEQCIDRLLPNNSQEALNAIVYRSDEIVWKVATEIYTKSGYQIDFLLIRELLNLRIESLTIKIAEEEKIRKEREAQRLARQAEEKRIRKQQEAQRLAKEAEEKRIRKAKEAERARIRKEQEAYEAKIKAELKAQRLAKEAEEKRIRKEQEEAERKKLQKYIETYSNIDVYQIFEKIKCIIIEHLEVEPEQVSLEANIMNNLGADDLDAVELVIALEEEFNIEIPDDTSLCHIRTFLEFLLKELEM